MGGQNAVHPHVEFIRPLTPEKDGQGKVNRDIDQDDADRAQGAEKTEQVQGSTLEGIRD